MKAPNTIELIALIPFILMSLTIVFQLLLLSIQRHHALMAGITVTGSLAVLASLYFLAGTGTIRIQSLLVLDAFSRYHLALIAAFSAAVALIAFGYLKLRHEQPEEFYVLLALASLGSMLLTASSHFIAVFLGIELLSISLYALVAFLQPGSRTLEAGIKFLVLASASAAFMLFGMALIYMQYGTMQYGMRALIPAQTGFLAAGFAMLLVGIGFKMAVVPFHIWTPDVYEGAPAPVSGFIASVSKVAVVAAAIRLYHGFAIDQVAVFTTLLTAVACLSMLWGNIGALMQSNVKRLLGYSSIAHLGYVTIVFLVNRQEGAGAAAFYMAAYGSATIAAFGVIAALSTRDGDGETLTDFRGLWQRHPWLTLVMTAAMLSFAGIPLTAGFSGKFGILMAGAHANVWIPIYMLILGSVIGIFYYLRVIVAMYGLPEKAGESTIPATAATAVRAVSFAGNFALGMLFALIIWLGVYPGPLMEHLRMTLTAIFGS